MGTHSFYNIPDRKSTPLTRLLGMGRLNAALLDPRLAPIADYARVNGGRYLGRAVGDELVKLKLTDPPSVADMSFPSLWDVLCGIKRTGGSISFDTKSWGETLDFYNLLVIELVRQILRLDTPPSGPNVNQRIVRCVGERPRSYRVEI